MTQVAKALTIKSGGLTSTYQEQDGGRRGPASDSGSLASTCAHTNKILKFIREREHFPQNP